MATLTERVLALTEQGFNFPAIAAILNVTPEQIEEVWEGQNANFGDPPAFDIWFGIECISGKAAGADEHFWIPGTYKGPHTCAMAVERLTPEGQLTFFCQAPEFREGTFEPEQVTGAVTNGDGTETLVLFNEKFVTLVGNEGQHFNLSDFTVEENLGEDLSVNEAGVVKSAAGGRYMASLYINFNAIGLV